jgi:hypothetical protein
VIAIEYLWKLHRCETRAKGIEKRRFDTTPE